jgi:hypothetical protein
MNPELDFEFYLAAQLHRTVAELRATISQAEFSLWRTWYARRNQRASMKEV